MFTASPHTPEILAPIGDWNMLRAAVHNGADAVYIGMPGFNARGRAATLEMAELGAMIGYAHLYGVKVFLACNILIFQRELAAVEEALRQVIPLGPDAFIVQDIGLVRLMKRLAPDQEVHASTQMTITNAEAIRITEDLGMTRYVLGREVSIDQMRSIRAATTKELEVFVHGALCVSYSGQCLTSESFGGRSANRGQCAQSCRLSYDLIVDGERRELDAGGYLVSPQDLCGLNDIARLVEIGIESFKIEGRLKSPAYVASTTRAYKEQSLGVLSDKAVAEHTERMGRVYSRGFFNGWFDGVNHQELVNPAISSHHGIFLGTVRGVERGEVIVACSEPLLAGDGILFRDPDTGFEIGASIFRAERQGTLPASVWRLAFSREFSLTKVHPNMEVYLNSSPHLEGDLERSFTEKGRFRKIPITAVARGCEGEPLTVSFTDDHGRTVDAVSNSLLSPAERAPLTQESVARELGALGGTVFRLTDLTWEVTGECFLHGRELKEVRRTLTEALTAMRTAPPSIQLHAESIVTENTSQLKVDPRRELNPSSPVLNLLIRESSQLDNLTDLPLGTIYLDFEFGKEYAAAADRVRSLGYKVGVATTRILKPGELAHLKVIERIRPDEVLVRNLGALEYLRASGLNLVGDFSLNVTNSLTAEWLISKGLQKLCPSYDLTGEQLSELLRASDPSWFEVTIHHYIPAFHMEHCVFASCLSSGTSYRDCGRPCEKHRVELRDQKGAMHPLKADAECRNTMFNGVPQSAAKLIPNILASGVQRLRVEALFDSSVHIREQIALYDRLVRGESPPHDIFTKLGAIERYGVTDGQLYAISPYRDRKKPFVALSDLGSTADPGLAVVTTTTP